MPDLNEQIEKFKQWDNKSKPIVVILCFIGFLILLFSGLFFCILIAFAIIWIPSSLQRIKMKKAMQKDFKENYLQSILQEAFPDATYYQNGDIIDVAGCRECNLFPIKKNMCQTEDGLRMQFGRNNDISLEYVEVYTYEMESDSDGNGEHEVTLFKGALFKYTFFKKFKDNLYIIPNQTGYNGKVKHNLFGDEKSEYNPVKTEKNLKKCRLEDVEFNELFSVYSENDEETFFILTPQYMSLMKDLYKKNNGKIRFKFSDNHMYIAISGFDLFDYDFVYGKGRQIDQDKTFEACVAQTKEEINGLVEFAETLELGDSIFM